MKEEKEDESSNKDQQQMQEEGETTECKEILMEGERERERTRFVT